MRPAIPWIPMIPIGIPSGMRPAIPTSLGGSCVAGSSHAGQRPTTVAGHQLDQRPAQELHQLDQRPAQELHQLDQRPAQELRVARVTRVAPGRLHGQAPGGLHGQCPDGPRRTCIAGASHIAKSRQLHQLDQRPAQELHQLDQRPAQELRVARATRIARTTGPTAARVAEPTYGMRLSSARNGEGVPAHPQVHCMQFFLVIIAEKIKDAATTTKICSKKDAATKDAAKHMQSFWSSQELNQPSQELNQPSQEAFLNRSPRLQGAARHPCNHYDCKAAGDPFGAQVHRTATVFRVG